MFIRHWRSENSPSTTQNSLAKFCSFPERASFLHNNSPVALHCSPDTTILNENLGVMAVHDKVTITFVKNI